MAIYPSRNLPTNCGETPKRPKVTFYQFDGCYEPDSIYGTTEKDFTSAYECWSHAILPEDRQRAEHELHQAVAENGLFNTIFRIKRANGTIRYIKAAGSVENDRDGTPYRMIGTNLDITDLKQIEKNLEILLAETTSQSRILKFISDIQQDFITKSKSSETFKAVVEGILNITGYRYGLLAEIEYSSNGAPLLKKPFLANISWDNVLKRGDSVPDEAQTFRFNLGLLNQTAFNSHQTAIFDSENNALVLPLLSGNSLKGILGISGFHTMHVSDQLIKSLRPLSGLIANLIEASRLIEAKADSDRELVHQRALLTVFVANAPAAIVMTDIKLN